MRSVCRDTSINNGDLKDSNPISTGSRTVHPVPFIPLHIYLTTVQSKERIPPHRLILSINGGWGTESSPTGAARHSPANWRRRRSSSPQNGYRDLSIRQAGGPSSPLGILCRRCWKKPRNSPTRWRRRGRRSGRWGPRSRLRGLRHDVWLFEKSWLAKWSGPMRHV